MSATPEEGKKHSHHHSTTKDVAIPQPQFLGPQRVTKVAMKSSECPVEIVTGEKALFNNNKLYFTHKPFVLFLFFCLFVCFWF